MRGNKSNYPEISQNNISPLRGVELLEKVVIAVGIEPAAFVLLIVLGGYMDSFSGYGPITFVLCNGVRWTRIIAACIELYISDSQSFDVTSEGY